MDKQSSEEKTGEKKNPESKLFFFLNNINSNNLFYFFSAKALKGTNKKNLEVPIFSKAVMTNNNRHEQQK